MPFQIGCSVSGGVTGSRTSFVKSKNGRTEKFGTREEAEGVASKYRETMGRNSAAQFHYWVDEIDEDNEWFSAADIKR